MRFIATGGVQLMTQFSELNFVGGNTVYNVTPGHTWQSTKAKEKLWHSHPLLPMGSTYFPRGFFTFLGYLNSDTLCFHSFYKSEAATFTYRLSIPNLKFTCAYICMCALVYRGQSPLSSQITLLLIFLRQNLSLNLIWPLIPKHFLIGANSKIIFEILKCKQLMVSRIADQRHSTCTDTYHISLMKSSFDCMQYSLLLSVLAGPYL